MRQSTFRWSRWVHASPLRQRTAGALCVVVLVIGSALIVGPRLWFRAPEASTAELPAVVDYLASEQFASIGSSAREAYIEDLASRYAQMSAQERQRLEQLWDQAQLSRSARRRLEQQMTLTLARRVVHRYQQLPEHERGAYLDRVAGMIATLNFRSREIDPVIQGEDPAAQIIGDTDRFMRDMNAFKQQLVDQTNAPERAQMAEVLGEIVKRQPMRRHP